VSERTAVYPGSFDPVTFGHLDILDRAAAIFDRVVVGVLENPGKTPLFTAAERVEMIQASLKSRPRIEVTTFDGLTVDFATTTGAIAIVRGLRVISDFESEFQMALMNRRLNPSVNTVFLMTSFSNVFISSSLIKEVCSLGGNVNEMAPPVSVEAMLRRFAEQREREAPST
jgi:pantetheine-phosphate adenylyltransferase